MTPGPDADQQVGARFAAPEDQDAGTAWVVRSEERARVAFPTRVSGRFRLTKEIVTEQVTQTFTLRREVLRVEEEAVDAVDAPLSWDAPLSEDVSARDFDMVLRAEQVVTQTVVVPVERIRVRHRLVASSVGVSTDVHREQIEVDRDLNDAPAAGATTADDGAYDDQTGATRSRGRTSKEEPA